MATCTTSPKPTHTLFPMFPPQRDTEPGASPERPTARLVGIARLAAASPCADSKRGTEYFLLPVRSILNRCDSERVPFTWTVNPYRGCEFGCRYCYARYTHEYLELEGGEFERKIYVKQDAGPLAARDLGREKVWGEHIAIGTATDPYQPAEREFGATRAILESMAEREGLSVSITTKSSQVVRDIDLLRRIAARSALYVNITVTTLKPRLARLLEPRAPRPDLRLAAVRALRDAGLAAGVFAMPVLPGLTDGETDLDALARAARDAGAQWLAGQVLFLMPSAQKQFLPFLEQKFPRLARQYREWYLRSGYPPEAYRSAIVQRVRALREKYGLGSRPYEVEGLAWHSPQLSLALEDAAQPRADDAASPSAPQARTVSSLSSATTRRSRACVR
ncbi:MAG TPA: radical SAM protein [Candidatus Acidoferrales bacterium]|nr:radical SAM protein [Candidatus Acidoferrales bacterium]